jgi:hypothetical protein
MNAMRKNTLEQLHQALAKIDRPGSFCAWGSAPAVLPGLEVKGVGPVGLPLTAGQARELIAQCVQAPYGKGEQTLVDTNVRRVWRLKPDRFSLTNPDWDRFIQETVGKVQQELGLEKQKLQSHLYDLLLYEPGGFFLPHRDGEKLDRMVATLVVVLPSPHEGGELIVRHDGQERVIDFGGMEGKFHVHHAAFYADCEHEVRPLRKGYRLCLVYNLTLARARKSITAPRESEHLERVAPLLREWAQDDSARKLVITLDHQYTQDGLAWDALKGVDRARARILALAARLADCRAYLALLTLWESGAAEYADGGDDYYGRSRWYDEYEEEDQEEDDEDNGSNYEMTEVFDSSLTAEHFSDPEGQGLPIARLGVEEDELLDPDALTEVDPEEDFEGYTGNAGMTLERWYRHGAILLWPEGRHFEVLCEGDSRDAVPVLSQMVTRWRRGGKKDSAALKAQCAGLARVILARWRERPHAWAFEEGPKSGGLLKSLVALDEPELIRSFLGEVLIKDVTVDPAKSLVAVCRKYGWPTYRRELETVCKGTTAETLGRNVRLLEHVCSAGAGEAPGWAELCRALGRELLTALETIDAQRESIDWHIREADRVTVLAGLARALLATGQEELFERLVNHALAAPKKYPLKSVLVPALESLRPWLKKNVKEPSAALGRWVAVCREQLEALTAQVPQEPTDFRREADISCKCADCAELKKFLKDPDEAAHRFSRAQPQRDHLENEIRQHKADLDLRTERRGRPYTLACTKNKASYERELKEYHRDQERLAAVVAIQESLPG